MRAFGLWTVALSWTFLVAAAAFMAGPLGALVSAGGGAAVAAMVAWLASDDEGGPS